VGQPHGYSSTMLTVIVVRHGEVFNPNHVVYADLCGFDLSPRGVRQVHALGTHLADRAVDIVVSSPLARARHTAEAIARRHDLEVTVDERLTESRIFPAWTGIRWEDVEQQFPEQLRGYLHDATALSNVAESVADVSLRVMDTLDDARDAGHRTIVVVGHQDPSQVLRLTLVGRPLSGLRTDPPAHASATTIVSNDGVTFEETSVWNPEIMEL
jgi:ribonuclease H / adenosylcobalamin/alpha-ribazole phosphatase